MTQGSAAPPMAPISIFDLFSIGIGPSSSHTVGPMRAARTFALGLVEDELAEQVQRVRIEFFGSLGATGRGHGTDWATVAGLCGDAPETADPDSVRSGSETVRTTGIVELLGKYPVRLRPMTWCSISA